jgi:DnaJ-class molecular chaperone
VKWKNRNVRLSDELARLRTLSAHELLNVGYQATAAEVQRAYHILVKVYHPDKADSFMRRHNEEVLKLINKAYAEIMAKSPTGK